MRLPKIPFRKISVILLCALIFMHMSDLTSRDVHAITPQKKIVITGGTLKQGTKIAEFLGSITLKTPDQAIVLYKDFTLYYGNSSESLTSGYAQIGKYRLVANVNLKGGNYYADSPNLTATFNNQAASKIEYMPCSPPPPEGSYDVQCTWILNVAAAPTTTTTKTTTTTTATTTAMTTTAPTPTPPPTTTETEPPLIIETTTEQSETTPVSTEQETTSISTTEAEPAEETDQSAPITAKTTRGDNNATDSKNLPLYIIIAGGVLVLWALGLSIGLILNRRRKDQ